MKQYKPIATYNMADDIVALFPCDKPKPDMADIIYNRYKEGYGGPHIISEPDEESIWTEDEVAEDVANGNFVLTVDKKHGVRFTRGAMVKGVPMGYYIDIYELVDEDEKDELTITDEQLKVLSRERREMDTKIKLQIIKEFKEHFTEPGQGLDFFQYCGECVYGMLDESGEIGKMFLNDDGDIQVELGAEWEDPVEEFESRYFACDDWPQLLLNVRRGIRDEWFIDLDDEDYA